MYIQGFSMLAAPLNTLVAHCAKGGKFYWNDEHKATFNALVDAVLLRSGVFFTQKK